MSCTILYVEDHRLVADAVRDTLEAEGWRVVACVDGAAALSRITSGAFSAVDCRAEAEQAGVDMFLQKPDGVNELVPSDGY